MWHMWAHLFWPLGSGSASLCLWGAFVELGVWVCGGERGVSAAICHNPPLDGSCQLKNCWPNTYKSKDYAEILKDLY